MYHECVNLAHIQEDDYMTVEIDESVKRQVREIFGHMENKVIAKLFLSEDRCLTCNETKEIMEVLRDLAPEGKLEIQEFHREDNPPEIEQYNIDKYPTLILHNETNEANVIYSGIPSGYEFGSLVEDILDLSLGKVNLKKANLEKIQKIDKPIKIQVFVTPTCPYCPISVRMSHKLAMANKNIIGEMVEATEFPELAQKYYVMGVPKTVINDGEVQFEGAIPEDMFVEKVMEAYKKA